MALKINLHPKFSQLHLPKPQTSPSLYLTFSGNRIRTPLRCSGESAGDSELASKLAKEVSKMNTLLVQREEAMEKSRELLFGEFCQYLSMEAEEVKKKWKKMDEEEKRVLVKGFVSDWGANFHPLSSRSVRELIEEHLLEAKRDSTSSSSSSALFPTLKKMMGF
ncbi:hypothetical protein UlMin_039138 [Ulmus minor]